jgi:hypothetical protein
VDEIKENWKYVGNECALAFVWVFCFEWKHVIVYCTSVNTDSKNLARFPPDSAHQQAEIVAIKDEDGYNWG